MKISLIYMKSFILISLSVYIIKTSCSKYSDDSNNLNSEDYIGDEENLNKKTVYPDVADIADALDLYDGTHFYDDSAMSWNNSDNRNEPLRAKRLDLEKIRNHEKNNFSYASILKPRHRIGRYLYSYVFGDRRSEDALLIWDNRGWQFPKQDVNFFIKYPSENALSQSDLWIITYVRVTISQNSNYSRGYILSGGLKTSSLVVRFESKKESELVYEIKIYGVKNMNT